MPGRPVPRPQSDDQGPLETHLFVSHKERPVSDREYRCDNTLFIYGNPLFADPVSKAAAAVFGHAETGNRDAFRDDSAGRPLIALANTTVPQLPPIALVAEFSRRTPELGFYFAYDHLDIGCNGGLHFEAGRVIGEWQQYYGLRKRRRRFARRRARAEKLAAAASKAGSDAKPLALPEDPVVRWLAAESRLYGFPVHAIPGELDQPPVSALPTLRAVAEELLSRALAAAAASTPDAASLTDAMCGYRHVKALLPKQDRQALDQLEASHETLAAV